METMFSPNYNERGTYPIERITVHCMPGLLSAKTCASIFLNPSRKASANYCIGKDGDVVLCVSEDRRAWTSGNRNNDYRAITFECASDPKTPYKFPDTTYNKLVEMVVDIMKRYKRDKLVYLKTKTASENYKLKPGEMILTFHRWYENVACPGDWFVNHAETFCEDVNKNFVNTNKLYRVQVGAFKEKANAERTLQLLKEKGFDGFIKED